MMMYLIVTCAVIYGAILASFVTLVGYRVPLGISVVNPPSHCSNCKNELAPIDLIPILSYVLNRGKCRNCGISYGSFHVWMEIMTALMFGLFAYTLYGHWVMMAGILLYVLFVNIMIVSLRVHGKAIVKLEIVAGVLLIIFSCVHSIFLIPLAFVVIGFLMFPRVKIVYGMQYVVMIILMGVCVMNMMWNF